MGIDSFLDDELDRDYPVCPTCETTGEETYHWYNICATSYTECKTITFMLWLLK